MCGWWQQGPRIMIDHEMRIEHISSMIIAGLMVLFAICSWYFYMQLQPSAHYEPDSICYDRVARNFAQTGHLIDPLNPHNPPVYPLGYPLFLGLLYYLFGMHLSVVIRAQIVLSLLSGLLLYCVANLLFGPYIALITTIIWFLHLGIFVYTQLVLSEIVLVAVCLLFWQQVLTFLQTGRILLLGSAGFLLGLSLIIKSIVLIFLPIFLLVLPGFITGSWMNKLIAELFVIGYGCIADMCCDGI
jgi:4-amino-4-deoxy-L-arabinose transferase-like glycosyltransferase